jgi:transmembrane sensor
MKTKEQEYIQSLTARILAGVADSAEIIRFNQWLDASESNRRYFEQLKNIWNESDRRFTPQGIDTARALENVLDRISKPSFSKSVWHYWEKVAAVILIPIILSAAFTIYILRNRNFDRSIPVYNEIYAAFGTRSVIRLADSTMVWLNSGSSLRYPEKFQSGSREVYLNGEAYFEVKSDSRRPFVVNSSSLKVKATGTKFNVLDYRSKSLSEVTLVTGKVHVNRSDDAGPALISELDPGQHLEFNRDNGTKGITDDDTYKYIAWKDGKLIFRNEPLNKVLDRISLLFNVDIELKGSVLQDYRYHATFQEESFEDILRLLKISSPIDYTEMKRTPLPDGTFTKKKVIIFPKNKLIYTNN